MRDKKYVLDGKKEWKIWKRKNWRKELRQERANRIEKRQKNAWKKNEMSRERRIGKKF